ncbi:transporter substrate-binding domain-containing protein [Ferrimonas sp. YFM]|uniref:ATP-binding protein n=1 Tax=Ferrimonas sp. YFM TaxID=3028878 RepID=UPI0025747642|nr:transporter substrate-binding domain-containing protein [Ferrimonas sp. YFM]BDY06775.1 histidine kinase [Ferrimonas sp. YFM]
MRWLWLLLCWPLMASAEIHYGIDRDFAPFEWLNEHGEPEGFNIDLMQMVADEIGEPLVVSGASWEETVDAFNRGQINLIAIGVSHSGEVNPALQPPLRVSPFAMAYSHIHTLSHRHNITNLNDLEGLKVAVCRGSYTAHALRQQGLELDILYADSERETLQLVRRGMADAAITNYQVGRNSLAKDTSPVLIDSGIPLFPRMYAFTVKGSNPQLAKRIQEAIISLSNSGQLFKLRERWFSTTQKIRQFDQLSQMFVYVLVSGLALFILVVLWNRTLRESVRKRTQELEQQSAIAEERAKLATLGTISAGIAHEINNPNGVILRASERLRHDSLKLIHFLEETPGLETDLELHRIDLARMEQELQQQGDYIHQSSRKISSIVKELKDYARPTPATEFQRVSARQLCQATQVLCASFIKAASIRLELRLPDKDLQMLGNKGRLEQVLVNLLDNAVRASRPGDTVTLAVEKQTDRVVISVSDRGHGMDAETQERATQGFFTTRRGEGGLGLGLAICQRIALEHQGTLTIHSVANMGTRIEIAIPLIKSDQGQK